MLAESQQAFQLALTAGAGDITTAGLLLARRRLNARPAGAEPATATAPAITTLTSLTWETFSQLLVWAWERLGYDVEVTDVGRGGVVDFILTDQTGYTYVQARSWQRPEVSSKDIQRLREDMSVVGVERGIWMTCAPISPGLRAWSERQGIRVIGAEELTTMVDRLRAGHISAPRKARPRLDS